MSKSLKPKLTKVEDATDTVYSVNHILKVYNEIHTVWMEDLCGACAVGSYLLSLQLSSDYSVRTNFKVGKIKGTKFFHVWIETSKFILDPTYEQLNEDYNFLVLEKKDQDNCDTFYSHFTDIKTVSLKYFDDWTQEQDPILMVNKILEDFHHQEDEYLATL